MKKSVSKYVGSCKFFDNKIKISYAMIARNQILSFHTQCQLLLHKTADLVENSKYLQTQLAVVM